MRTPRTGRRARPPRGPRRPGRASRRCRYNPRRRLLVPSPELAYRRAGVTADLLQAHERGQLRDRVIEQGARGLERPHELAEQLEADHPEQLRPGDDGADHDLRRHRGETGGGHQGGGDHRGLVRQRAAQPRPGDGAVIVARWHIAAGHRVAQHAHEGQRHAGRRSDRRLRSPVSRDRRTVDQRVLVRVRQRPAADRVTGRQPPDPGPRAGRDRGLGDLPHGVVGVDDQRGQQVVAAREVAVQRRGHHAELARDCAQRQSLRARLGQLPAGLLRDLARQLGTSALPRGGAGLDWAHLAPRHNRDQLIQTRAVLLTARLASCSLILVESSALAKPGAMKTGTMKRRTAMNDSPRYVQPKKATNFFNEFVGRLTRPGISVYGSRVLYVRGRKSGEWRSNPVSPLTVDGTRYLVAPRGTTQWVRNLRAADGTGELRIGRRVEPFRATEITDDDKPAVLRAYLKKWKG